MTSGLICVLDLGDFGRVVFLGELHFWVNCLKGLKTLGELYTKYGYPWTSKGQELW